MMFMLASCEKPRSETSETFKVEGVVIDVDEINVGTGSHHYEATHKLVRYTFPEDEKYQYYTVCGDEALKSNVNWTAVPTLQFAMVSLRKST